MSFIANILDLNKATVKTAFLVLLISGALIFMPNGYLVKLQLNAFKIEYGKYFGIAFLSSSAFLVIALFTWVQKKFNLFFFRKKFNKQVVKSIADLDPKEIAVLREFYINGQRSLDMPIDDPIVAGLLNKGILYYLSSMGQMSLDGTMFALAIRKVVADKLTNEFLGFPPGQPNQAEINLITNSRPDWAKSREERRLGRWY